MATLQEGQTLLERIRKAALLCTYSTARHATTSACHAIERLLQLLRDKWRKLEELWIRRLLQLQQCLQLGLADQESTRVCQSFTGRPRPLDVAYLSRKKHVTTYSAGKPPRYVSSLLGQLTTQPSIPPG